MMRRNQYKNASSEALVGEYAAISERQQRAIEESDNRTYGRLYPRRKRLRQNCKIARATSACFFCRFSSIQMFRCA
jgi:hypothetical protein